MAKIKTQLSCWGSEHISISPEFLVTDGPLSFKLILYIGLIEVPEKFDTVDKVFTVEVQDWEIADEELAGKKLKNLRKVFDEFFDESFHDYMEKVVDEVLKDFSIHDRSRTYLKDVPKRDAAKTLKRLFNNYNFPTDIRLKNYTDELLVTSFTMRQIVDECFGFKQLSYNVILKRPNGTECDTTRWGVLASQVRRAIIENR
jgi:hypothetical protein